MSDSYHQTRLCPHCLAITEGADGDPADALHCRRNRTGWLRLRHLGVALCIGPLIRDQFVRYAKGYASASIKLDAMGAGRDDGAPWMH